MKRKGKTEKGIIRIMTAKFPKIQPSVGKRKMGQLVPPNTPRVKVLLILPLVPMRRRKRRTSQNPPARRKEIPSKLKRWRKALLEAKRSPGTIKKNQRRKKNGIVLGTKKKKNTINLQTSIDNEHCSDQG